MKIDLAEVALAKCLRRVLAAIANEDGREMLRPAQTSSLTAQRAERSSRSPGCKWCRARRATAIAADLSDSPTAQRSAAGRGRRRLRPVNADGGP